MNIELLSLTYDICHFHIVQAHRQPVFAGERLQHPGPQVALEVGINRGLDLWGINKTNKLSLFCLDV